MQFDQVRLAFATPGGAIIALEGVDLSVPRGEITTVVGPSGCGKTTLLRLVAGFVSPSSGSVRYKGERVTGFNTDVGYVTQESNLFPWLTALENAEFPLAVRGVPKNERRKRSRDWLQRVGLGDFEDCYPAQLSGGMQKRVAIVRTLIYEPDVVLMDEPFGALDAQTRMLLHDELLRIWSESRSTILFITHDLVEAITLSDRVVVMTRRPGRVKEVYRVPLERPRNVFEIYLDPQFDAAYAALWAHFKSELAESPSGAQ